MSKIIETFQDIEYLSRQDMEMLPQTSVSFDLYSGSVDTIIN
jgi:hypothetical protein